ncbi:hypothetical protein RDABS01_025160 [Bienertia sinuspersici]
MRQVVAQKRKNNCQRESLTMRYWGMLTQHLSASRRKMTTIKDQEAEAEAAHHHHRQMGPAYGPFDNGSLSRNHQCTWPSQAHEQPAPSAPPLPAAFPTLFKAQAQQSKSKVVQMKLDERQTGYIHFEEIIEEEAHSKSPKREAQVQL